MIVADDRYAVGSRCSGNGNRPVEVQAAVKIGPGKRNRVGALRRDDIGSRGQSLRHRQVSRTECYANNKARDCFHYQVSTTLASPKKTIIPTSKIANVSAARSLNLISRKSHNDTCKGPFHHGFRERLAQQEFKSGPGNAGTWVLASTCTVARRLRDLADS